RQWFREVAPFSIQYCEVHRNRACLQLLIRLLQKSNRLVRSSPFGEQRSFGLHAVALHRQNSKTPLDLFDGRVEQNVRSQERRAKRVIARQVEGLAIERIKKLIRFRKVTIVGMQKGQE